MKLSRLVVKLAIGFLCLMAFIGYFTYKSIDSERPWNPPPSSTSIKKAEPSPSPRPGLFKPKPDEIKANEDQRKLAEAYEAYKTYMKNTEPEPVKKTSVTVIQRTIVIGVQK
jgi:heme/copper-type cytochrome/quinol oxidase subunit 1